MFTTPAIPPSQRSLEAPTNARIVFRRKSASDSRERDARVNCAKQQVRGEDGWWWPKAMPLSSLAC